MKPHRLNIARLSFPLAAALAGLFAVSFSSAQTTYTWANSNITATPPANLDWFTGGPNTQGTWSGGTPVNSNLNTIQFFNNAGTNLANTGNPSSQTSNINNGGSAFQLGTLTLSGLASATNNAKLNLTISGDALNFSAATGTINLDANNVDGDQLITYNLNSNIQLGTASSASVLTLTGGGSSAFNFGGIISELQVGGGSLVKSGASTVSLTNANTYTDSTTINAGILNLGGSGSILNSAITLTGGELRLTNTAAETGSGRITDSLGITSNGGTLNYNNTSGANVYAETIGSVALTSGQLNFNLATNQASTGSQTLTLSDLTRTGASNSSAVTFSAATTGPNATKNRIQVSGKSGAGGGQNLPGGVIIGPWATTGTAANSQNDYAVYDASGYIVPAIITASAETTWTDSANAYTLSTPAKTATALTVTRNITALKASSTATATSSATTGGSPTFTIASGHSFNVGDPVMLSSFSGDFGANVAGQQFTVGTAYYVASVTATTFTLAGTPGGTAINAGQGRTVSFTGGLKLDNGINLGTSGILNSGNAPLSIGRSSTGGELTLPTAGAGNLYITTGLAPDTAANSGLNGRIAIDSPIVDNSGALTLVKNGASVLRLQGTNTYTGGTVINAGTVTFTNNNNFGSAATPITFNGSGALSFGPNYSFAFAVGGTVALSRPVELNNGAIAGFYYNSPNTTMNISGAITGDGGVISGKDPVLTYNGGDGTIGINFTSTDNTFTGPLTLNSATATFNSLADGSGSMILNTSFTYGSGAIANLSIPNRLVDVRASTTITNSAGSTRTMTLGNISTTTSGAKTLTLSNASTNGAGFITGNIANGAGTIGISKSGTGTFTLSGTNTYSGTTAIASGGGTIIMKGDGAYSTNTTVQMTSTAGSGSALQVLNDAGGVNDSVINVGGLSFNNGNTTPNISLTVGNNGGSTTGATVSFSSVNYLVNSTTAQQGPSAMTANNSYKYRFNNVSLPATPGALNWTAFMAAPTSAAQVTVASNLQQPTGSSSANRNIIIQLDGTNANNAVTGDIKDATDTGNANWRPLGVTKASAGTWTLPGTNTYTGNTRINGGTLVANSLANGTDSSSIGSSTADAARLILAGGTLQYAPINSVGATGANTNRNFTLISSSTIDASGTDALVFDQTGIISPDVTGLTGTTTAGSAVVTGLSSTTNLVVGMTISMTGVPAGRTIASIDSATQITLNSGTSVTAGTNASSFGTPSARTLTLTGTNTDANTIAGILQNSTAAGSGALSVTKSGNGTWVLSNANTYTGATTVSAGTLAVTGSLGATAVSVNGTSTLGGNGNIGGNVTIGATATHALAVAANTGAQVTRAITGTLTLTAGNILNLTAASTPAAGVYELATATTITGTPTTVNYNGITGAVTVDTSGSPHKLLLTVTGGDATPPTLTSITDNVSGGPVDVGTTITYTVTFSEDIDSASVSAADFDNSGSAGITVGAITETTPGVFTVAVTATSPGSLKLRIPTGAVIKDLAGNDLVVPVEDDSTITIRTLYDTWSNATYSPALTAKLPTDDQDGDGFINLMEYAFGTPPTVSSAGSIVWDDGGAVTNPGQPVAINLANPGVDFRAVFGRRKDYVAAGLTYTVEFSAGLDVWVPSGATPTVLTGAGGLNPSEIEAVSVPYPLLIDVGGNNFKKPTFFRVTVSN